MKCRGRLKSVGDYLFITNKHVKHNHEPDLLRVTQAIKSKLTILKYISELGF